MKYFVKIRPMRVELFHSDRQADRRTDMKKLIVAFRNFPNAPKNNNFLCHGHWYKSVISCYIVCCFWYTRQRRGRFSSVLFRRFKSFNKFNGVKKSIRLPDPRRWKYDPWKLGDYLPLDKAQDLHFLAAPLWESHYSHFCFLRSFFSFSFIPFFQLFLMYWK